MERLYCASCGALLKDRGVKCCGQNKVIPVSINPIPQGASWGRVFETEIVCPDLDVALAEAEDMVDRIDIMASPSIVSKARDDAGNWRLRVRSYTID